MEQLFQSFIPSPELQPFVERYWRSIVKNIGPYEIELLPVNVQGICFVLTTGAKQELIATNGRIHTAADAYITGQLTSHAIGHCTGDLELFSVQFKPYGMYAAFGIPMHQFTDTTVPLAAILNTDEQDIIERIREAPSVRQRINSFERFLLQRIQKNKFAGSVNWAPNAYTAILAQNGNIAIDQLAKAVYMSKRKLQRHFMEQVGVTPKTFCNIIRMKKIMQLIEEKPLLCWKLISYQFGYTDPAHFANDFKRLMGKTPSEYYRSRGDFETFFSV